MVGGIQATNSSPKLPLSLMRHKRRNGSNDTCGCVDVCRAHNSLDGDDDAFPLRPYGTADD
jgi:hypothetical protein